MYDANGIKHFEEEWDREIGKLAAQFDNIQAQSENLAAEMSMEHYKSLQISAKSNLFFLCTGILGFDRLSPRLHGDLCGWMKDNEDEQFREILLPRGHFKSTVATIGDSIRLTLPDVTENEPWPSCLGTDIRLLIAHEAREQAARFLFAITQAYLSNILLRSLFPKAIPNPREQRINKTELELPRTKNWPEPTIDTMGVGARSQGRHYNFLKLDDLIGDEARDSETVMKGAIQWFNNIQSFFSTFAKDHFDLVGTRWKMNDLYHHVHQTYEESIKKYIRPVLENGEAIFPEEFSEKKLAILRKDPIVWTSQYLNDPSEGAQEFLPEWKRFFTYGKSHREVIQISSGVPEEFQERMIANGLSLLTPAQMPRVIPTGDMDIIFLIDPAMSGDMGFIVTGMDSQRNVFVLEAIKKALRPPEFIELLFDRVRFWWPRTVVIEEVLFSGLFADWLPVEMSRRGVKFHVSMCKTRNMEKDARVRQLTNYFSAGQIYFHNEQKDLEEEYDYFGTGAKYHLLDALAQGPKYWLPGNRMRVSQEGIERERERLEGRSIITGYSKI